ncbi:putative reverse transcriptase domain-containing protein [Tanacetum coccineum]
MSTVGQGMSSMEIEQVIAQRVTNAIEAIAIYEARTRVTRDSMDQVARQGAKVIKDVKNKREWESGYDIKSSHQQSKRQKVAKACAAEPNDKRGYAEKFPSCNKCKLHHAGPCPIKCKKCQKVGHHEKDCRVRAPATGDNFLQNVTCFGCGEQGHYKNRCPRLKNQNHGDKKGKGYLGNLPLCNRCKLHQVDQCPVNPKSCSRWRQSCTPNSQDGIHVDPSKVESAKNWKTPESPTEICSFLGLALHMSGAEYARRLYVPERVLKEKLCNAPVLALPDGPNDFVVYCDASNQGFGCVLMQRGKYIFDQKELNMRQRRWIELLSDYESKIKYHPGKANVVVDALSIKERLKPKRVRAMSMTIQSGLKAKILKAQGEASKDLKAPTEWLRGLEIYFERRDDGGICFFDQIWIPSVGSVRKLIMDEAHTTRYSVHSGANKMYYDLRDLYWWPGIKRDIADYEKITMDLVTKFSKSSSGYDAIWVIVDRSTKSAHFLPIHRNGQFTSPIWKALQKVLGTRLNMSTAYHPQTGDQSKHTIQTLEDMLQTCVMDFGGSWDNHLPLVEFSYNNSYHKSIKCAPFETLYGKKCRSLMIWAQVEESQLIGPEIMQETTEKIIQIKERLKTERSRQKSYVDKRRKPLEFKVEDHVLLKVSPWKE